MEALSARDAFYTTGRMTNRFISAMICTEINERITDMMHHNVLSSSYVLYLPLLFDSSKVHFACENTPVKQRHP